MMHPSSHSDARGRPWTLWTLSAILTMFGAVNVALAVDQALGAAHYRALGVSYPLLLRAVLAAGWGAGFLTLGWGLARRRRWAWRWAWPLACNYGVFNVLWLWAFAASDYARGRIPFLAALTLIALGVLGWVLRWRRVRAPLRR